MNTLAADIKMNNMIIKRVIFLFLALFLNAIEVVRNNTTFDWWSIGTNLTGLVILGYILTQIEIKMLCNIGSLLISVLAIVVCLIPGTIKEIWPSYTTTGQIRSAVFNIWWILIVAAFKIKESINSRFSFKCISKSSIVYFVWAIASIWGTLSRSEHIWPLWTFCMFSLFFFTDFSEEDWQALWNGILTGTIWFFVAMQLICMPFRPYDRVRYSGFLCNSNDFAKYLSIVYLFILVKLHIFHIKKSHKFLKALYVLVAGVDLAITFMTGCRTIWVIDIVLTIVWAICVVYKKWKVSIVKTIIGAFSAFIFVVVLIVPTYFAIRYIPTIHPHPIWFVGEYHETRVFSWDPADSEKYVSFSEMLDNNLGRLVEMLLSLMENSTFALKAEAKSFEQQESVFIDIYDINPGLPASVGARWNSMKAYMNKSNLFGNRSSDYDFYYLTENGVKDRIWHSQNYFVQLSFMFGIPVGILAIIIMSILLVKDICVFNKEDSSGLNILPLLYWILYFMYGLVEVTWLPGYLIFSLAFLIHHPKFSRN